MELLSRSLAIGALAAIATACTVHASQPSLAGGPPPTAPRAGAAAPPPVALGPARAPAPPPPGPATRPESFHARAVRQEARAFLFLPGSTMQRNVAYQVVDGMAVFEGDMVLGPAHLAPIRYGAPPPTSSNVRGAVTLANREHLWKTAEVPYVVDRSAAGRRAEIDWAVGQMSTTALRLRPRQPNDQDYVVFYDRGEGEGCWSYLGRIGGPQDIEIGGCGQGSLLHEILHAAGFYHEQSRGDRDEHVTIAWNEIDPAFRSQFEKRDGRGQDVGAYDYDSIMHYSSRAFSTTGNPTIIPRNPAAHIGQREALSVRDREALAFLYGNRAPGPGPAPGTTPPPPPAMPAANAGFAGAYSSQRGAVTCTQNGASVSCQFPGGGMLCNANGAQLDCGWSGGGSGRAVFARQPNGVLAGTYGDFLSTNSRGAWDLVPTGNAPAAPPAQGAPGAAPPPPAGSLPVPPWPLPPGWALPTWPPPAQ